MGHDPYISRDLHTAIEGDVVTPRVWAAGATGEPRAVIEAIQRLNEATHLARRAGWFIDLSLHPQGPDEASNGPHRELRATISREV
jgi:hypothetical protein